jgi:hypothetical protein
MPYTGKLFGLINGSYVELREIIGTFDTIKKEDKRFDKLWEYYGMVGNRKLAFEQWTKLTEVQIGEVRTKVVECVKVTPIQYRKGLQSYLNPKTEFWNDVVIDRRPETQTKDGFTPHIDNREEFARLNNEVDESVFDDLISELGK